MLNRGFIFVTLALISFFISVFLIIAPKKSVEKETKRIEILTLLQKTDLVQLGDYWFIVIQNYKKEQQLKLKDPLDNSINTYPYRVVISYPNFKVYLNPNLNNEYNKILLKNFIGVY